MILDGFLKRKSNILLAHKHLQRSRSIISHQVRRVGSADPLHFPACVCESSFPSALPARASPGAHLLPPPAPHLTPRPTSLFLSLPLSLSLQPPPSQAVPESPLPPLSPPERPPNIVWLHVPTVVASLGRGQAWTFIADRRTPSPFHSPHEVTTPSPGFFASMIP